MSDNVTVKDLISVLSEMNEDAIVLTQGCDGCYGIIKKELKLVTKDENIAYYGVYYLDPNMEFVLINRNSGYD